MLFGKISANGSRILSEMKTLSLPDVLAEGMGYPFISDLRQISGKERLRMAQKLEALSADAYPLAQWNEALAYLIVSSPEDSPGKARNRLTHHCKIQR